MSTYVSRGRSSRTRSALVVGLVALHAVALALQLPLGLVLPPVRWTFAFAVATVIAAGGALAARRSVVLSSGLLIVAAAWWILGQAVLRVAP